MENLSEEIVRENCDFVLVSGDMINGWLPTYKFNWNNISRKDDIIYFLTNKSQNFNWIRDARIERINDTTIEIADLKSSLSLRLNDKNNTVIMKINGFEMDNFRAVKEDDELNIYYNLTYNYETYKKQFKNWKRAMGPLTNNSIRIFTVRGNHEDGPGSYSSKTGREEYPLITYPDRELLRAYNETLGKDYPQNGPPGEVNLTYSFTHENALFIGLDEYVKPHRVNQGWLDEQLAKNSRPFVFVFGHEPAFQISHPDCLAYYSVNRSLFWDSLGRAGCRIYFCGHDHLYDLSRIPDSSGNMIYQMVISSGAPKKGWAPPYEDGSIVGVSHNNQTPGYVLVTMRDNNNSAFVEWKEWNARDANWITKDYFNLKGKEDTSILLTSWMSISLIVWIILFGWLFVVAFLIYWRARQDKDLWCEENEKKRKVSWRKVTDDLFGSLARGDYCGKFEDLVTSMIVWIAIPAAMAGCWLIGPMYHEKGLIAGREALPVMEGGTIVEGVTIFVVVYFVTQMIERIVEFFSNISIFEVNTNRMERFKIDIDQLESKIKDRLKQSPNADVNDDKMKLDQLMDTQNCLESSRKLRLLAASSGLGIIFSYFFIGLFALVGIASVPHWIDALISGIILGGGSKPLHDLITSIERKAS